MTRRIWRFLCVAWSLHHSTWYVNHTTTGQNRSLSCYCQEDKKAGKTYCSILGNTFGNFWTSFISNNRPLLEREKDSSNAIKHSVTSQLAVVGVCHSGQHGQMIWRQIQCEVKWINCKIVGIKLLPNKFSGHNFTSFLLKLKVQHNIYHGRVTSIICRILPHFEAISG